MSVISGTATGQLSNSGRGNCQKQFSLVFLHHNQTAEDIQETKQQTPRESESAYIRVPQLKITSHGWAGALNLHV